ncbi:hypothetical protein N7492_000562 [Penicillium capsulatum]|uniref:chitinase n=1 Tax=Penicillium capsulatum TaxID=69766 RepID=A0A9W9IT15_9EURO|nr:hypothetical protein N7492_000562 [Penicillium capsulatum]KAJ6130380.1 hypothetical protein N7512_003160 [Penicillium capsulatum]
MQVFPIAFDMMVNGPGGAPEVDFSVQSKDCDVFEGTQLKNCPNIAKDIETCQKKDKTIILSIGGATYSEGGFKSESDAKDGAKLMWETFGPKQEGSKAKRPFGDVALDGFDFDFEANVQHMATFANELRSLMDQDSSKKYFLTAAPQCPYPDQNDKDILNGPVSIDAVWVQFYNNFCGVNNFNKDSKSSKYNFEEWDNWAKTVSKNKDVKVMIGVPADTTAASTGYVPADKLAEIIEYTKKFESFGGVMLWDATQAYNNKGYINSIREAIGGEETGSSSSTEASSAASAPSSTNSPNTTPLSTNGHASLSSSSSSSASGPSSSAPEHPEHSATSTTSTTTTAEPIKPSTPTESSQSAESTTTDKPTEPAVPTNPTTTVATTSVAQPSSPTESQDEDSTADNDSASASSSNAPADDAGDNKAKDSKSQGVLGAVTDLFGLLGGLRQANGIVDGAAHGLKKTLRRADRIEY